MDEIIINGNTYLIPTEYSYYVIELNNTLTLSRSGSITLYSDLARYNNSSPSYPRITLQYGNTGRYITQTGVSTTTNDLIVSSWEIKHKNLTQDPMFNTYLLIIMAAALIWRLFKS